MHALQTRASLAVTLLLVGVWFLFCLVFVAQLLFVVPSFERQFEDFRMRVPFVTEMAILASRFAWKYWFLWIPALILAAGLAGWLSYLVRHRSDRRWLGAAWFVLLMGMPLIANATVWGSMWVPMRRLHEGLAK